MAKCPHVNLLSDAWLARLNRSVVTGRIIPYLIVVMALIMGLSAVAVEVFSPNSFESFGDALWWAATTVTTIGYGDVVPGTNGGRLIAVPVMLAAVATVSLTTAVITASFVGYQQRRLGHDRERHEELMAILTRIEQKLEAPESQR